MPEALAPLWQVKQAAVRPVWLKCAGFQAVVVWQSSQLSGVWRWVGVLPGTLVLLWQEKQVPVTCVWSTLLAGDHAVTVWQDAQLVEVVIWFCDRPVAGGWALS